MAKLVQRRRGTTAEHGTFTGAEGEITHDTDKETIVVHDGTTQGGFPLAREDLDNVNLVNRIGVTELNTSEGADGQVLTTDGAGHLSFTSVDVAGSAVGGDLTGTVSNTQIGANTVGITELDVEDGTNGQLLTTNGSGVLSFESPSSIVLGGDLSGTTSNAQIVAGAVGTPELATDAVTSVKITDLNVTADKLAVDSVTTTKIADAQVTTSKIADSNITLSKMAPDSVRTLNILDNNIITSKIGDSQVTKLKIADNSVDVAKLDVTDGNSGDILSTNGVGVLSFIPQLTSLSVGGVLTGTTDNASIANNAVVNAMLATGIDAGKLIGELSSNVTGVGGETFASSFTTTLGGLGVGGTFSVTNCPFEPSLVLFAALGLSSPALEPAIGGGTPTSQSSFLTPAHPTDNTGQSGISFAVRTPPPSGGGARTYYAIKISAFLSNGFTLQLTAKSFNQNQNPETYHYIAWS